MTPRIGNFGLFPSPEFVKSAAFQLMTTASLDSLARYKNSFFQASFAATRPLTPNLPRRSGWLRNDQPSLKPERVAAIIIIIIISAKLAIPSIAIKRDGYIVVRPHLKPHALAAAPARHVFGRRQQLRPNTA